MVTKSLVPGHHPALIRLTAGHQVSQSGKKPCAWLGLGLVKQNGTGCGVGYNPCPHHADSGLSTILFLLGHLNDVHTHMHIHVTGTQTRAHVTYEITAMHCTPASYTLV